MARDYARALRHREKPMDKSRYLRVCIAFLILAGGCTWAPPPVHSMQAPQANFGAFKTFAWDRGQAANGGAAPISILDGNIRTAIASELQKKGYAEAAAESKPDLVLQYE